MSVHYQIVFQDGQKLDRTASCFGATAHGEWEGNFSGSNALTLCRRPASDQSFLQLFTDYIHPCWVRTIEEEDGVRTPIRGWGDIHREKSIAERNFFAEAKLLLEDCPMLNKVISIHPLLKVVRGHFKNNKADQIITSLFCLRNLMSYSMVAYLYRKLRNQGFRPRIAIVVAHQVSLDFNAMGQKSYNDIRCGETNWINPETFGAASWQQWMNQTIDSEFGFNQEPWRVQKGYRRDGWYERNNQLFDTRRSGYGIDWTTMESRGAGYGSNPRHRHRKAIDGLSVALDNPIQNQFYNEHVGMYIVNRERYEGSTNTGIPARSGEDAFNRYMESVTTLCRDLGHSVMMPTSESNNG